MTKKPVEIGWKPRKKKFVEVDSGLEVAVVNVNAPKHYDVESSASRPLMVTVDELIKRAARGTPANAYRWSCIQTHAGEYRADYHVTIELYKILQTKGDQNDKH